MRSAAVSTLLLTVLACGSPAAAIAQTNVLTQHNDVGRTGLNATETVLTPANVNASLFGKLYSIPIDGQAYAQPLYLSSLAISGVNHSVLFVATEHDSVFAFDTNAKGAILWQASMTSTAHGAAAGATSDPLSTTGCIDVQGPEYGIKSTPVIDPATNTLYTMSRTLENGGVVQRLHALDVTTGAEKFGGPVTIAASVPGTGIDAVNGVVTFNPTWENQRPGLLLLNGTVYIAWGSVCDNSNWHGWIMGYSAATGSLARTALFITTPNGDASGIWMGGAGLAADTENGVSRIFVATGNGTYDATLPYGTNTMDYAEDILALTQGASGLTVTDEFTPDNQSGLTNADEDLGSGGVLVLPDNLPGAAHPHLALQIGKSGTMILMNRDNLGGYSTTTDNDVQEVNTSAAFGGLWGIPAYWNGNVYFWPANSSLQQYAIVNGTLSTTPAWQAAPTEAATGHDFEGTTVSVSSNGSSNPIVWANDWVNYGGAPTEFLYAFDATNVSHLLWSSTQYPARDGAGAAQKWAVPTIADGRVYVAAQGAIQVYGLVPPDFSLTPAQSAVSVPPTSSANIPIAVGLYGGFSGTVSLTASGLPSGVTASFANNVLTLTVAATAPATSGEALVTVTGVSGTLTHAFAIQLNVSKAPFDDTVSLAASFADDAIATDGVSPANGGFDADGYAYSAKLLGTSLTANGIVYNLGAAGAADAASSATITIPATAGAVGPLNFLAAAANGNQLNQVFTLKYTDGSQSTFTQSISDWGSPQSYSGESIALSMAYRIAPGGATNTGPFYVYAYSAPLTPGKVLASVTLPANRNVVVLAVTMGPPVASTAQTLTFNAIAAQTVPTAISLTATSSSGLAVYYSSTTPSVCTVSGSTATMVAAGTCTITASQAGNSSIAAAAPLSQSFAVQAVGTVEVTLTTANKYALASNGTAPLGGGFDGVGNAFSANLTGSSATWSNSTFNLGTAGTLDAVTSATVSLPAGSFTTLKLIGAATFGTQTNQAITVTYTDGTTTAFTQSFSDWGYPQNYAGEAQALSTAYRVLSNGTTQTGPWYLYGYAFGLNPAKTVKSLTLPNNANVVIVAVDLVPSVQVTLTAVANKYALATNGTAPKSGGFDGNGYAFSANLTGTAVTWANSPFTLGAAASLNAVANKTIPLPSGNFSTLKLLAAGANSNQPNQSLTVTYADGTTSTFTQGFSDWGSPQNYVGESQALSTAYRVTPSGATQTGPWYLFGYSLTLNAAKTVKSLTLPNNVNVVVVGVDLVP